MANYNTFIVIDCKSRKPILITSSARKAQNLLTAGVRIEVWCDNQIKLKIYAKDNNKFEHPMTPYIVAEKNYIRNKQKAAEERNRRRCKR